MQSLLESIIKPEFLFSVLRITSPILFAALAAVVAEKAGKTNIGLEGTMMVTALLGSLIGVWTQNAFLGLLGAILIGALLGLTIGFFALKLRTDIILAGIAINTIGAGGTIFMLYMLTGLRGNSGGLANKLLPTIEIPLIKDIPYIGEVLSGHCVLTYFAFLCVLLVYILLYKTPLGLKIRAVGENANAADSVGVSVRKISYIALGISGALAGMGGAYMSMYYLSGWYSGFVAGRGFIALAARAMGNGEPVGAMLASLLFGVADAVGIKMSGLKGFSSNLVAAIPYIATVVGLAIYAAATLKKVKKANVDKTAKSENIEEGAQ
ncbi:MAG: ABC transporter permease [Oscillospiraceae bacterium]